MKITKATAPHIESGVPIIRPHRNGVSELYPWKAMEIGDSIFCKNRTQNEMRSTVWHAGRRHGRKFSIREMRDGVRIWRIQ